MDIKILYFTNGYKPDREGVSKELYNLYFHFSEIFRDNVHLLNIADDWQFRLSRQYISCPDVLLPIGYPVIKYLEHTANLIHIYGSLTGRLYLKILKKKPCILTSASALVISRLEECISKWAPLDLIVLESERDKRTLLESGIDSKKIRLIYPGIPMFNAQTPVMSTPFNILFASAPISADTDSLKRRGVTLLIETAKRLPDCHFIFLWRGKHIKILNKMLSEANITNITVIDEIVPNIVSVISSVHCTILCPLSHDECKPCPNSLIETLACGRPVLASDRVGISSLLKNEQCGVIFSPVIDEIESAIRELQNNYGAYMKNALSTAIKYFSMYKFLKSYENLYRELGITN